MKSLKPVIALASASLLSLSAVHAGPYASPNNTRYDYAKVVDVDPIYRTVRVSDPREECWDEEVPVYREGSRSATPMILGGIIGGVVGHTMGKGRGKDVATVAGTVLGGSIGRDIGRHEARAGYDVERRQQCRVVDHYSEEQRIDGYHVTYRYKGEDYVTVMDRAPGTRLRVAVHVEPAE